MTSVLKQHSFTEQLKTPIYLKHKLAQNTLDLTQPVLCWCAVKKPNQNQMLTHIHKLISSCLRTVREDELQCLGPLYTTVSVSLINEILALRQILEGLTTVPELHARTQGVFVRWRQIVADNCLCLLRDSSSFIEHLSQHKQLTINRSKYRNF